MGQFAKLLCLALLAVLLPTGSNAVSWFSARMMSNSGIWNTTSDGDSDCASTCVSLTNCSAASYSSDGTCWLSACSNLILDKSADYNTYIYNDSAAFETFDLPTAQFEWMMTSTCGLQNIGSEVSGPEMTLFNTSYAAAVLTKSGNAVNFLGGVNSYARVFTSDSLDNDLNTTSLTVMFMVYWNTTITKSCLFEFSENGTTRGIYLWYLNTGFYYHLNTSEVCNETCTPQYNVSLTVRTWYHVTFMYDAANTIAYIYLNGVKSHNSSVIADNRVIWDNLHIGGSPFEATGPFLGRMYCFKVFKTVLTTAEISALYKSCVFGKIRLTTN